MVPEQEVEPDALNQPSNEYKELLGGVSCDNYITMDDDSITLDTASEDWEAVTTSEAKGEKEDDEDDSDADEPKTRPL